MLHDAAWSGDVALIEILIGAGAQVDARHTETGSTPLHYAAITNHVEAVAILLDKGAQISAASKTGATALHLAANRGYKEIVELLLGRGAKVDARDDHGGTPLVEAAWKGHVAVVRLLLEKGANVNAATTDTGATALHEAAAKGHDDVVELLLSHKADPAVKDRSGSTAPEEALRNRQARVVGVFMDRGVIGGTDGGASQLKNAVMRGQTDMTAILLDRGVDPNAGFLLHDAALKGFVAVADALIAHGAKVNAVNASGSMPLHDAALAGKAEMVDFLLSKSAEINARDRETGSTALHLAASWGRTDALRVLLKRGADPAIVNKAGVSPLAAAVANGQTETAAILKDSKRED